MRTGPLDYTAEPRTFLRESLQRRVPTYQVARAIMALDRNAGVLSPHLRGQLQGLGRGHGWVVDDDFDRVVPATRQVATFRALFPDVIDESIDGTDADQLLALVAEGMYALGEREVAPGDVLRSGRRLTGADRKRLRFLNRLVEKAYRMQDHSQLRHAMMQAKSRLAYRIDPAKLGDLGLMFCAYLAARANRRSIFMVGEQSRARDTIVDGLLSALNESGSERDWEQVALVMPTRQVISRLKPEARGMLIATFHREMAIAARQLARIYPSLPERMRGEMVVVRGVDSSRWNAYAGALNTMRSAWISAVLASDLDQIFDRYLPGKAPRLMAADVAWMYRNEGRELHEDTRMFLALAKPWDIINGVGVQSRADVSAAGAATNVSSVDTGWVGPRATGDVERPEPEPALVHGVVVTDPDLARTLRRCGAFSGRPVRYLDELLSPGGIERGVEERDDGSLVPYAAPAAVAAHDWL